ncbi:prevent-host-death family protein [Xylanimonas cellulosilytica DSM 15894]|uniref:Antitoxin n=1 Tax=Xylanimonas cellulosilytica (strain DSM 15894 / JCM 12276 / CECT 5975 / KCTC 9989 / LMG 20990 / NBRC 107835 / XIL07) TaxID=446471 RepID=D1BZ29_XYLCX|nr:type II toxin-antitoxin system Phd/YefM family antitoxin [Xylanimonas cellulosilytica]ACZ31926.1 prevent-host-death family protein [Xylanimonas cellulosilytica DSM 15894]
MRWQVQEAKQRFSELLRATAAGEPQIVTKHGKAIAVVIDYAEYELLRGTTVSFLDYLGSHGEMPDDFEVERTRDLPRETDLTS